MFVKAIIPEHALNTAWSFGIVWSICLAKRVERAGGFRE